MRISSLRVIQSVNRRWSFKFTHTRPKSRLVRKPFCKASCSVGRSRNSAHLTMSNVGHWGHLTQPDAYRKSIGLMSAGGFKHQPCKRPKAFKIFIWTRDLLSVIYVYLKCCVINTVWYLWMFTRCFVKSVSYYTSPLISKKKQALLPVVDPNEKP